MRRLLALLSTLALLADASAQLMQRPAPQVPVVVLTQAADVRTTVEQLPELRARGFGAAVITGPGCLVGRAPQLALTDLRMLPGVTSVVENATPGALLQALPEHRATALRYLNELLGGSFETPAVRAPMDWNAHPVPHALEPPHDTVMPAHDHGNERQWIPQAQDWTCGNSYNTETMEGVVVASTFFIESNGTIDADLYTWTTTDINSVKSQVIDAWSIWSYSASLYGRTVTAVMDWYEPSGGIPVQGYEPVTRAGSSDGLWIDAIMTNAGRTEFGSFSKLNAFNQARRAQFGADRAFCAFVAYNPSGAPTAFTDGKIGYAYLGGPYTQILWRANGWSSSQINRVYGHEVGHIFHAFDEYSSSPTSNCSRSFNGRPNSNYQGSTCNGTAGCVMINNAFGGSGATRTWNLCSHTPYHLGWLGTLTEPASVAPVNDSIVTVNPVVLRFNRAAPPIGTTCYLKVYDRANDSLVYCGAMGTADTLALSLVNGEYRWTVSVGLQSSGNGYAGVVGDAALFRVNAPLTASFTRNNGTICAGGTVTYTNTSTGAPASWTWSFPGGSPSTWTGKIPPPITYMVPGTYSAALTVGDGLTTSTTTLASAVTVASGEALPFAQGFNGGAFPPGGWILQGGTGGQGGSLNWSPQLEPACGQGTAAGVNAYVSSGMYVSPVMRSPRIDLTQATMPYLRFKHSYVRRSTAPGARFSIAGNNCNFTRYAEVFSKVDSALSTNGGTPVASPPWVPATCSDWRENIVRLDSLAGHVVELNFRFTVPAADQDLHVDDILVFNGVRPAVRALLDGPFDPVSGLMHDHLRTAGLIPATEPYTAMGFPWRGEGGGQTVAPSVLAVTGPDAIVDWVVLEVRDSLDATKVLASRAALLQRDGDIVDVNGVSAPRMPVPAGNYRIAVHHRNHLPVCTATPVPLGAGQPLCDLSLAATSAHGTDARRNQANGRATLWSGDAVRNLFLSYTGSANDRDAVLMRIGGTTPTATATGYWPEDTNLDGVVKYTGAQNDRDPILFNIGGTVPTNVRNAQLP